MNKDDAAFPLPKTQVAPGIYKYASSGLTKRELFAMTLAAGSLSRINTYDNGDVAFFEKYMAPNIVKMADSLLAELDKDQK